MNIKKLASKMPFCISQPLRYIYFIFPVRLRYDRVFWETYNFLQESQWWSRKQLEDYQLQQLSKLLQHAYENVPYYRGVFDERGLKPKDICSFDDLKKLPYLTKDIFRLNSKKIVAQNANPKNLLVNHTSGTTGKPLQFYNDICSNSKEDAFIYHQWARMGVKPGDPIIQLRGPIIQQRKPFCYDPIRRILRLSPQLNSKEIVNTYLQKMSQLKAKYLHGYPSIIAVFASMIKQYGFIVPFKLKAALFASETTYRWEREITEEVFNCRVFSHYGMAERVVLAGECEKSTLYHCVPQYGITEIHPTTNEIVGTGFLNYANPFIRYVTNDVASVKTQSGCNDCNRQYYPVLSEIEGRLEDFIITAKKTLVSPAVITHPFKDFKTIKNAQLIQTSLNCVRLKVVAWDGYNPMMLDKEITELRQGLQKVIGPEIKIEAELVGFIQGAASGKFRWIISEISKDALKNGGEELVKEKTGQDL